MVLCFNSPYYVRRTTQQTTKKKVRIRLHNGYGSTRISSNLTVHFLTNGKKKRRRKRVLPNNYIACLFPLVDGVASS